MTENKTPEVIYVYQSYLIANATIGSFSTNIENSYGETTPYILKSKYDELSKRFSAMETNNIHLKAAAKQRTKEYDLLLKEKEELEKENEWISVEDRLPDDFDEAGQTPHLLVVIDNPFFKNGYYHVAYYQKTIFGRSWQGIEPNVSHGKLQPNVTHWKPLPKAPIIKPTE